MPVLRDQRDAQANSSVDFLKVNFDFMGRCKKSTGIDREQKERKQNREVEGDVPSRHGRAMRLTDENSGLTSVKSRENIFRAAGMRPRIDKNPDFNSPHWMLSISILHTGCPA